MPEVDDGGATPVQDERDSGSDAEDEVNEQHSGSENGSVGHQSEEYVGGMTFKGNKTFETA
ncbi:PREDICTED: protein IWS1 homolog [Tinamus guttatus]|uniref:protein IWS1 homolog n=1 Tax=Tinamus guttatus TaxID=94827 RepID=UPI00052EC983|nr:PREDICTED: protein IWS1 homolog [Tinamus guttatus]